MNRALAIMHGLCDYTNAVYVTLHTGFAPDPYQLSIDATPTGIGDPLAGVLRSIDELLEGQ